MSKQELSKISTQSVTQFLLKGGKVNVIASRKLPKQVTAGAGSIKHCGKTNLFGQRI